MDPNERTVTFTIAYVLYDRSDFHPWYPFVKDPKAKITDTVGWLTALWWNTDLLTGLHRYCAGKKAQPYDLWIEVGTITTTLKWGGSTSIVIDGWPGRDPDLQL